MSYDLLFWKQEPPRCENPVSVFESLNGGQRPAQLTSFPVEEFLQRVQAAYPEAVRELNGDKEWMVWTSPSQTEGFEINWSDLYVWVTLRPLASDRANRFVEIANALDAPLFDPQTGERFDAWLPATP